MREAIEGIVDDHGGVDASTLRRNPPGPSFDPYSTVRVDPHPATRVSSEKLESPLRKPASVLKPTVEIKGLS